MIQDLIITEYEVKPSLDYVTERNKPMPSFNHGSVQGNLITEINVRYRKTYSVISELKLKLDIEEWGSVPDICIYSKRPIDLRNDIIAMREPPLCAIEIISPTQSLNELIDKADEYFAHGVKSCWLVLLPLGNIYVFTSPDEYEIYRRHDTLRDEQLNISFPLKEVFE